MEKHIPGKYTYTSANTVNVIDLLNDMASDIDVIPLANLMWNEIEEVCFPEENSLLEMWKREMSEIRGRFLLKKEDLENFLMKADVFSETLLQDIDTRITEIVFALPDSIARLQEEIFSKWQLMQPKNAFFPALEKTFRAGETRRFHHLLNSQRVEIIKPVKTLYDTVNDIEQDELTDEMQDRYTLLYQGEIPFLMDSISRLIDRVLSFYERKWSLFLSPKQI